MCIEFEKFLHHFKLLCFCGHFVYKHVNYLFKVTLRAPIETVPFSCFKVEFKCTGAAQ